MPQRKSAHDSLFLGRSVCDLETESLDRNLWVRFQNNLQKGCWSELSSLVDTIGFHSNFHKQTRANSIESEMRSDTFCSN